jgi:hypothetical protein
MALATCPSREELQAFSDGMLAAERDAEVAGHLETCPSCQAALDTLPPVEGTWASTLARPVAADPFQEEPQCQAAVARFEAALPAAGKESPGLGTLGPYELLAPLGRGGMGTVYRARHTFLNWVVALKLLPADRLHDEGAQARFRREMEAVGRLQHPNLVAARDAGVADGQPYLALELLEGLDLSKLAKELGRLPVAEACAIARQAALGLQHAHEHGLVHRDIKLSNLWLTPEGQVKVLDLGLARFVHGSADGGESLTETGQVVGTPDYLAPETVERGKTIDGRADLYSLGCTLYRLLTGTVPFSGPEFATPLTAALAHVREPVPSVRERRPDVPEDVGAVVERLLAKKPEQRFDSAAAVADVLRPFAAGADLAGLLARVRDKKPGVSGEPVGGPEGRAASTLTNPPAAGTERVAVAGGPSVLRRSRVALLLALAAVALVTIIGLTHPTVPKGSQAGRDDRREEPPAKPPPRLVVRKLDVSHWAKVAGGDEPRGLLGEKSFTTRLEDGVILRGELSEPAYCYLIAYRPNGTEELCFPERESEPPALTDQPGYGSVTDNVAYNLTEGVGLEVFMLVVSRKRLPAYTAWRTARGASPWRSTPALPGLVWRYDGEELTYCTEAMAAGQRGKGRDIQGGGLVGQLAAWLRQAPDIDTVAGLGFPVLGR